ncbi:PepSY domain-containing protein [Comamonas sp.]|uniref:PepSY domain-containing protein n=1 Tax=Comamonas sp. TaxID=34028 RepID=UPI003A941023
MSAGVCLAAPQDSMESRVTASLAAVRGMALGPALSIREVCDRLEKMGYREFREVEWDDGRYKVKATANDGRFVKLDVDGRNGDVLRVRSQD